MLVISNQPERKNTGYLVKMMQYQEEVQKGRIAFFLAYSGKLEIGFSCCRLSSEAVGDKKAYLEDVYVLPTYRGQGIAQELVSYCGQWATKQGAKELIGRCDYTNKLSYKFNLCLDLSEEKSFFTFVKKL